jgi:hypothetical protein
MEPSEGTSSLPAWSLPCPAHQIRITASGNADAMIGAAGVMHVRRLEDPDRVDERRRSVGLGPHAEYLEHFRKDGAQVVVDR